MYYYAVRITQNYVFKKKSGNHSQKYNKQVKAFQKKLAIFQHLTKLAGCLSTG